MAEQFLNKLAKLEEKIDGLGETLKRMVTILSEVTEIKSEIRLAKEEILESTKSAIATSPKPTVPQENVAKQLAGEFSRLQELISKIQEQMDSKFQELMDSRLQQFQEEIRDLILSAPAPTPIAPITTKVTSTSDAAPSAPPSSISASKSMKIAEYLETVLSSLKMGCTAGDVLDAITEAKDVILKIVESDPIMIKIDRWAGEVGKTPRRKELQAREILKLKKELRTEIDRYSPA